MSILSILHPHGFLFQVLARVSSLLNRFCNVASFCHGGHGHRSSPNAVRVATPLIVAVAKTFAAVEAAALRVACPDISAVANLVRDGDAASLALPDRLVA